MKKSYYFSILMCLCFYVYCIGAEQQGKVIDTIETAGNTSIKSTEILSKVRSRAGDVFDQVTVTEDTKRVATIAGIEYCYYNASEAGNKIKLTFVVVEKNLARSIVFKGNKKFKSKVLEKQLGFLKGDYLDSVLAETGRKNVVDYYHKKGYAFVQASFDSNTISSGELTYTIDEGPRVRIAAIDFSGNKAIKSKDLKKTLKVGTKKFLVLPNEYEEDLIAKEVAGLQNTYYERGYLDNRITVKNEFNKDKTKIRITYVIEEGPVYTVEKIAFSGNTAYKDEQLLAEMKLKPGEVCNLIKAKADEKSILKIYRESGFIDASEEMKKQFVPGDRVILEFAITEGERFRIGQINITGNEQTQDKVIRRVLDEHKFQPGNWFNADIARSDGSGYLEKQIKQYAYTESATITPTGQKTGQKDALVNITEGQTGQIMLGAGVSSDNGLIGQLIFEQRNFDSKNKPESFEEFITGQAYKGAGQTLRIALQPGTEVSEYSVNFTEPYLYNKPISMDLAGSYYERERESYNERRIKGYVGFEKRYADHLRRGLAFRAENVRIFNIDDDAPKQVKEVAGSNNLFGTKFSIGKDYTDNPQTPTKGFIIDGSYEQVVWSDGTFGIVSGSHRWYKTLYEDLAGRKTIFGTKLLAASIVGDAPVFEKFYAGGNGLYGIRGFKYRGVSTRGYPTFPGTETSNKSREKHDPIGSDWIAIASAEVVHPLVGDTLSLVVFTDSGVIDTGGLRASVGTGIQILIPQWFGPVPMRFEVATPFIQDEDDKRQLFSFSVGRLF